MASSTCTTAKTFWVEKPAKVASFTDVNKTNTRQNDKSKIDLYRNLFRFQENKTDDAESKEKDKKEGKEDGKDVLKN